MPMSVSTVRAVKCIANVIILKYGPTSLSNILLDFSIRRIDLLCEPKQQTPINMENTH